jgi:hypothetical protein
VQRPNRRGRPRPCATTALSRWLSVTQDAARRPVAELADHCAKAWSCRTRPGPTPGSGPPRYPDPADRSISSEPRLCVDPAGRGTWSRAVGPP